MKILLAGMVAGDPWQGGASWAVLQYVAGLRSLGHEVVLVEPVDAPALRPEGPVARYFRSLPSLSEKAALLDKGSGQTLGLPFAELVRFARDADLLINVSGMLRDERLLEPIPTRLFLDLDPGFNQAWEASGEEMGMDLHTHFATVGGRVGRAGCPIPTCGRSWIQTLPPVALEYWPAPAAPPVRDAFTSVGHWRSYGSIEQGGVRYGQRAHSMRELIDLPGLTQARIQLALGIHPDEEGDLDALVANGWELLDPLEVAASPDDFAAFVRGSKGELCVAKSGYVSSRSGWFSDRSACYLASGRPVVAQDTGFPDLLPTGEGLLAFTSSAEAAAALDEVAAEPVRHGRAARALAEQCLDARKVLSRLLERVASVQADPRLPQ